MHKKILDSEQLSAPKTNGVKKLASVVKKTLGPGGLPIIIERQGQALDGSPLGPKITKDGVSVAEVCGSPDKAENAIIQTVLQICKKTNADAGDGTTTAIVLGEAILEEMQRYLLDDPSLNAQLVKESVEKAARGVVSRLSALATPVESMDLIEEVATISANGDREVGAILRKAFEHVGAEGSVTVDEGSGSDLDLDLVEGYRFNRGAQAQTRFFNNKEMTQFEAEKAAVLLYDGNLRNFRDLVPFFEILAGVVTNPQGQKQQTKQIPPVVIVANDFSQEAISFLLMQKAHQGMQVVAVKSPHTTHVRTAYLDDLAVYLGGTRLGNGGRALTNIEPDDIGLVDRVVIDKYNTTLYGGQGAEDAVLERVNQLKAQKQHAESPYDAQIISDRLASLTNGIAKIGVGGTTELEIKEKYDRIEDALNASRAAIQEGIVPGGGSTLLRLAMELQGDASIGEEILSNALQAPFERILLNIGYELDRIDEIKSELLLSNTAVYDARNLKIVDAMDSGIIDPVKVTRTAFENAVSIATLLSTTGGAVIFEEPKKK